MTSFSSLGLAEPILRALKAEGYNEPTPIQARAIAPLLEGRDLLGIAQTGTGKTAAFALPIIQRLMQAPKRPEARSTRVLVLAPTRELAAQIADSFRVYSRYLQINVGLMVGGVALSPQIRQIAQGLDVLVATPGRLLDHVSHRHVRLDLTEVVVLDEADHMLDLGFIIPIRQILKSVSRKRQTLLFSATMPREIAGLANEFLNDPTQVAVTPVATTAEKVAQEVILIEAGSKRDLLLELLARPNFQRTIVFTRTKRGADRVSQTLEAAGISAAAIHGNKSQGQRQRALDSFRAGKMKVLVATDIAARGIDIDNVTHVVNFELPDTPEAYVHRIGRTARAGASGAAVSLCSEEERGLLRAIERLTRSTIPLTDRRRSAGNAPASVAALLPRERRPERTSSAHPGAPGRPSGRPGAHGAHKDRSNHGGHAAKGPGGRENHGRPAAGGGGGANGAQDAARRRRRRFAGQGGEGQREAQPN